LLLVALFLLVTQYWIAAGAVVLGSLLTLQQALWDAKLLLLL
jgi:hypothetical protein